MGDEAGFEREDEARGPAPVLALALGAGDPALRDNVRRYLDRHAELAALQIEDLKREDGVRHWGALVRHISDVLKLAFELALAVIFTVVAVLIGVALWTAAHDNSVVIEAFSVPPDMAARGMTGQAVAARLQDRLAALQDATNSARPADSYANAWGDDIKVQIPDTGVSIGEFYRILTGWLGHQTHISGEVFRNAKGLSIVARAGTGGDATVTGSEDALDALMQRSAEAVYARTQPYRYAAYIQFRGKPGEARAIYRRLAVEGQTPRERAWAYIGLSVLGVADGNEADAVDAARKAIAIIPDFALGWEDTGLGEAARGHDEAALAAARTTLRLLTGPGEVDMSKRSREIVRLSVKLDIDNALDDFAAALRDSREQTAMPEYSGLAEGGWETVAISLAGMHDVSAARRAWNTLPPSGDLTTLMQRSFSKLAMDTALGDWRSILKEQDDTRKIFARLDAQHIFVIASYGVGASRQIWPAVANAMAATGDFAGAHALIDKTPLDCFACLRSRGRIDALQKNWTGTNAWFARATAFAPSIPLGYSDWGQMLLWKGDLDAAITKFSLAHDKGPHFADPLEMWGEALIVQNRSDLALAKFEETNKYAPNWGRLHLKWGAALLWSGDRDGARRQFALAANLDLSANDRAVLARLETRHG